MNYNSLIRAPENHIAYVVQVKRSIRLSENVNLFRLNVFQLF